MRHWKPLAFQLLFLKPVWWYSTWKVVFPVKVEGRKRTALSTQTKRNVSSKKTYTKEFKEEAVGLAQLSGNTSEIARNLGLQLSVKLE